MVLDFYKFIKLFSFSKIMKKQIEVKFLHDCLLIKDILVIGDLHIGYGGQFDGRAIFPGSQLKEIFEKLNEIFEFLEKEKIKVKKIVLLGDVKHDFGKITDLEWRETLEFFNFLKKKLEDFDKLNNELINDKGNVNIINKISTIPFNQEGKPKKTKLSSIKNIKNSLNKNYNKKFNVKNKIIVIRGNHDNILKPIVKKIGIKLVDYYCVNIKNNKKYEWLGRRVGEKKDKENKKICFLHGNRLFKQCLNAQTDILVFGHLHPAITLYNEYKSEKYKCFLKGKWDNKEVYILPNFGSFSLGYDLRDIANINERDRTARKKNTLNFVNKIKDELRFVKKSRGKFYGVKKDKNRFFVVPNNTLKNFEVVVYNNQEKKEYNFGKLNKLLKKDS